MEQVRIRPFAVGDDAAIIDLILAIQRDEFDVPITAEDQPDLRDILSFYQSGAGQFLVAELGNQIVGTIALKAFGPRQGALRKMFVAQPFRGRELGVAHALLERLLDHARDNSIDTVFLGTIERFLAAHRFYEKAGFHRIAPDDLPEAFPRVAVDTRFYRLDLRS